MIIHSGNYKENPAGTKAGNLFFMAERGIPVPGFFCMDQEAGAEETGAYIREHFPETEVFAVRSAAKAEDGSGYSYAGQFETELFVPACACYETAQQIFRNTSRAGVYEDCVGAGDRNGTDHESGAGSGFLMYVIIQEMIDADLSGVIFTANPQGLLNESVIVAGMGTGDKVVEDQIPVATCYFNRTDRLFYCEGREQAPLLTDQLLFALAEMGERIEGLFGTCQDIEFAVKDGKLLILQARPITTFPKGKGHVILDNSNIVESYPGITLPATQSFVRRIYYSVFRNCVYRLCRDKQAVKERKNALENMVDVANGRVYYRISNWYEVLRLLPFSDKIIPVWQEMLGVREKDVEHEGIRKPGIRLKWRVTVSFFYLLLTCPREMEKLNCYFEEFLKRVDLDGGKSAGELLKLYYMLEKELSSKWDITLVNDMYTFLYTALLKKAAGEDKANEILSGITGLESMKPVRELLLIARYVKAQGDSPLLREMKQLKTNREAEEFLKRHGKFAKMAAAYTGRYGDRYMEELKLESRTFRTDPLLFIRQVVSYAEGKTEMEREKKVELPGGLAGFLARRAAAGIRNRELSRMNRSRIFGIVREILLRTGAELKARGILEQERDVFFLFLEEAEKAVRAEWTDGKQIRELVGKRKEEYRNYEKLPAYSRLVFCGEVFNKQMRNSSEDSHVLMSFADSGELSGTPCSGGLAEGEVLVVQNPEAVSGAEGKILVAAMTDPGWVFLIAGAKALVVEKGSLLSHTAIVSRELKKPSVTCVLHATEKLKDGDWIRVNGTTGMITVLKKNGAEEDDEKH